MHGKLRDVINRRKSCERQTSPPRSTEARLAKSYRLCYFSFPAYSPAPGVTFRLDATENLFDGSVPRRQPVLLVSNEDDEPRPCHASFVARSSFLPLAGRRTGDDRGQGDTAEGALRAGDERALRDREQGRRARDRARRARWFISRAIFPIRASCRRNRSRRKISPFARRCSPIAVGTKVEFPNLDDTYHNIFSYSPAKRFDLGRYPPDERPAPVAGLRQGRAWSRCAATSMSTCAG